MIPASLGIRSLIYCVCALKDILITILRLRIFDEIQGYVYKNVFSSDWSAPPPFLTDMSAMHVIFLRLRAQSRSKLYIAKIAIIINFTICENQNKFHNLHDASQIKMSILKQKNLVYLNGIKLKFKSYFKLIGFPFNQREFPYPFSKLLFVLKSRKKSFYLNGRAIKRGEGCKGRAIKEKSVKIKIKSQKKFQVMGRGGRG